MHRAPFPLHLLAVGTMALSPLPLLAAESADPTAASVSAVADSSPAAVSATATEIAYWKQLQEEIAALRAANSNVQEKMLLLAPLNQLNDIMARVEGFLDARDADPVDDLDEDLAAYREQLMAMLDTALNPLRAAARFQEQLNTINFQARAEEMTRYLGLIRLVDDYKYTLADLHEKISTRVVASGGPRILFFQNLNLGDEAFLNGAKLSPLERDQRFVDESRALDPAFATIAEGKFLAWRRDGRIDQELEAKHTQILEALSGLGEQLRDLPPAELQSYLDNPPPPDADPTETAILHAAIRLEQLRRDRPSAHALRILDWKSAFARWLGQAQTDSSLVDYCRDVAVAFDQTRYAFSADGATVQVRDLTNDTVLVQHTFSGAVRGLTYDADHQLMVFTTTGLFQWDDSAGAEPTLRNESSSPSTSGRIAAAADRPRHFYAWANLPEIADAGRSSTLRAAGSSSISALALSRDGLRVAIGYTGENNLGGEDDTTNGVAVLNLPADMQDGSITAEYCLPPYIEAVTAVAFNADASRLAMATVANGRGTISVFDPTVGTSSRTILTLDDQPYAFISFLESGDTPRVLAASRTGLVRAWDLATGELIARGTVPVGPQGVAYGLAGEDLIAVALGTETITRQPLADFTADTPELAADRALRPLITKLEELIALDGEEEIALGRSLLTEDGEALDRLGRRRTVITIVGNAGADRIEQLKKAKDWTAGAQLGRELIAEGFGTRSVYYETISCVRALHLNPEATRLTEEGLQLFPTSGDMRYQYHYQRMLNFTAENRGDDAHREIDEIDNIHPDTRPHRSLRRWVFDDIGARALEAKREADALQAYLRSMDYCESQEEQIPYLETIFSLAYNTSNWQLTVNVANALLNLKPDKKNDQNFMACARYAYSQTPAGR